VHAVVSPPGAYVYVKDYAGSVHLNPEDPVVRLQASSMAYLNEVGVFRPGYYGPGLHQVNYTFILHPPIEYDDESSHLNLKLASSHIPYESVIIVVKEAAQVEEVYLHPPTLRKEWIGDEVVIRGACPEDQLLEVELLLKKEALSGMKGFPQRVEDVKAKTMLANLAYTLPYYVALSVKYLSYLTVTAIPITLLYVYWRHGRERRYVTPRYLSYPPVKRKPWLVNLIFKGDVSDFDENGLYATLLDLHMKGKLNVKVKEPSKGGESGLQIQVLDPRGDDEYENMVLKFFSENAFRGTFDTDEVRGLLEQAKSLEHPPSNLLKIKNGLNSLISYRNEETVSAFAYSGRKRLMKLLPAPGIPLALSILLMLVYPYVRGVAWTASTLSALSLLQLALALAYPSTLFGRWKGEHYKEKLEWDAFKNMLSNLAQMERYGPQDLSM
jgi:uncharacterized membrane protein